MRRILLISLAIILVVLGALVSVPFLIPKSVYRDQIQIAATRALGREVTLSDDVSLSVFPQLRASVRAVTVANPEGFSRAAFITAGELRGAVRWGPLLSGRVEISELAFVEADVQLEVNTAGANNWTLAPLTAPPTEPADPDAPASAPAPRIDLARLQDARLAFIDAVSGQRHVIDQLDLSTRLTGPDEPFRLDAKGRYNTQAFTLSLATPSLAALSAPEGADLSLKLDLGVGEAEWKGLVALGTGALDGNVRINNLRVGDAVRLTGINPDAFGALMGAIGQIDASARVSGSYIDPAKALRLENVTLRQDGEGLTTRFEGALSLGTAPGIKASRFSVKAQDVARLMPPGMVLDPAFSSLIGRVEISGGVDGLMSDLKLTNVSFAQNSQGVATRFNGALALGATPSANGRVSATLDDLARLSQRLPGLDPTLGALLGKITLEADANGPLAALKLSQMELTQASSGLTTRLEGSATLSANPALDARLSLQGPDVAALLETLTGAPSPLKPAAISLATDLTGALDAIALGETSLKLGDSTLSGALTLSLAGPRPRLTGTLSADRINLDTLLAPATTTTPATPATQGWSEEPLPLQALTTLDADIALTLGRFTMGPLTATDTGARLRLEAGRLDLTGLTLQAFGGALTGGLTLDVSGAMPRLGLSVDAASLQIANLSQTFAGMAPVTGAGGLKLRFEAAGASPAALVRSLTGEAALDLGEGQIAGINLAQLLRTAQEVAKTGRLPTALSPQQATDFTSLIARLPVRGGVIDLGEVTLLSPVLRADASGTINLGARTLNVSLFPRALQGVDPKLAEFGVDGYGLPIRLSGSWTGVSASLDTAFLLDKAKGAAISRAKAEASKELEKRVGGELGGVLGSVLGLPGSAPATPAPAPTGVPATPAAGTQTPPKTPAGTILGTLGLPEIIQRTPETAPPVVSLPFPLPFPTTEPEPEPVTAPEGTAPGASEPAEPAQTPPDPLPEAPATPGAEAEVEPAPEPVTEPVTEPAADPVPNSGRPE
jgi:AsmA protein